MAINISDRFLEANTARQFGLKTLIRLAPVRRKLNPALRAVLPKRARASEAPCTVTDAFDAAADHYQKHRWAFVENIFEDDFHAALARNYPPRRFLQPVAGLTKSYDRVSITDRNRDTFTPFPELLALSDYLQAPAFEARVSRIGGQDGFRTSGHLHLTRSWPGTFMIPHQDSALESDGIEASPRRAERCVELGLAVSESTGETMADEPDVVARGPFDVVHSSHVVEHVYDLRATMSQVRRLLKPGGIAIVVVPNILSENMLVISQGIFHIRNFTPESLAHLFAVSGFEILEQNVGDGIEIVARMTDLPAEPPVPDAMAAARLHDGLAERLAKELGVASGEDGTSVEANIFVSRPPASARVWRGGTFPLFSKPGLLSLMFGAGFREAPVFGPQGRWVRLLNLRNLAFKLRRRLFGVGRLEIAAALRVESPKSGGAEPDAPALTVRFPAVSVPILLK